jgi:hypothetical protein
MSREGREGGEGFLWTKILIRAKSIYEKHWIANLAANLKTRQNELQI